MAGNATRYRPDIDGLRAVAVVAVIAYHLQAALLPGGFLGVDVFFVISGYLITSIIWREIGEHDFSILRFYERRVRRIGPALLATLAAVTFVAAAILLPVDLIGYARSLLATLVFVSNIYFWRDTDYFSRIAAEKPLLHTWSLGIEEQFYLLFPLILIGFHAVRRSWTPALVSILTIVSFAANVVAVRVGADHPAFFLLPTRAWELGSGALIVFARPPSRPGSIGIEIAAAVSGILLLVSLAATVPFGDGFLPAAFVPIVATSALIWIGQVVPTATGRLLGTRAPVAIGRVSYSLYLWHWPVIVFGQYYLARDFTPVEMLAAAAAMAAAAAASFYFIEQPFRRAAVSPARVVTLCLAASVALATAAGLIAAGHGFPQRLSPAAARINAAVGTNYRCPLEDYIAYGASHACRLNLPSGNPADADVVLLGNSHAQMYAPLVAQILQAHHLQGLLVPANGCLPWTLNNISIQCAAITATNLDAVTRMPRARTAIMAFNWQVVDNPLLDASGRRAALQGSAAILAGLDETITRLRAAGKTVIVIGPVAAPGWDVASIASRRLAFGHELDRPLFEDASHFSAHYGALIDGLSRRVDIVFVRPDRAQCRAGRCDFVRDGASLFADDNHLAAAALGVFGPEIEPAIVAATASPRP